LFVEIYGGFGGFVIMRSSGYHFDKTQDILIPADQIQFAAMVGVRWLRAMIV
jgi:hypothetical protein